jgi:[ribosomal protein S5]-alanine N-acetyltransferase
MGFLRPLTVADAEEVLAMRIENRTYFLTGEPVRDDDWFTLTRERSRLMAAEEDRAAGRRILFGVDLNGRISGYLSLSDVVRGAFHNAYLGYAIAERAAGQGIGTAVVGEALEYAWDVLRLHRVQANVATTNLASQRVMLKNGFRQEGTALRYLHIGGEWRDHHMYAKTVEER